MPDYPLPLGATPPSASPQQDALSSGTQATSAGGVSVELLGTDPESYYGFGLTSSVVWHSGLASAPTAGGPRARTVFWRVCAESSRKIITFAVARLGAVPAIPHIDTGSGNDVLLSYEYSLPSREVLPDGTVGIVIYGQRIYGMQSATDPTQPLLIPNTALDLPVTLQLYPESFSRLLVGPMTAPPAYDGGTVSY